MQYSIVIATRNRLSALELSVPRMLDQSAAPEQLIVVDSSDDHISVRDALKRLVGQKPVRLTIVHSERGLTHQRNVGLELVSNPVVFFPDDDSIWFPGMAEKTMEIYDNDTASLVSAVCAVESATPPPGWSAARSSYRMSPIDRVKPKIAVLRIRFENAFVPDPDRVIGRSFIRACTAAPWQKWPHVVPVEWMTGFRMSFRTETIRSVRFDTNLRRYSLFEDHDASFGAWRHGAVVAALNARVYHYRSPERRDGGRRLGAERLLNQGYVVAKHTEPGHPARSCLRRFAYYKCLLYLLGARDRFGRERLAGARAALRELSIFTNATAQDSASLYKTALEKCLPS